MSDMPRKLWLDLTKQVSLILVERMLAERDLADLTSGAPDDDRHTDRCLRSRAQELGEVSAYVALGLVEGFMDTKHFNNELYE